MPLPPDELNKWVDLYTKKYRLPSTRVPCSTLGCNNQTALTGDNLHERAHRFGGIRELLTTFKCRRCRGLCFASAGKAGME
jgi:hypothetical protein